MRYMGHSVKYCKIWVGILTLASLYEPDVDLWGGCCYPGEDLESQVL